MDIQKERELFLAHMRSIGSAGFMFELDEDGNFDDMSMSYAWSAWQAAKAQAVPEGYILIPKKMPDEVNDHLWDFMTDNFVCTNDYGDSFMACDDFNLDKFYAELVKAQEPAND